MANEATRTVGWYEDQQTAERIGGAIFAKGLRQPILLQVRESEWAVVVRADEYNASRYAAINEARLIRRAKRTEKKPQVT